VATHIWTRFRGRIVELRYQVFHNSLFVGAQTAEWGELKATWQGMVVPNLHHSQFDLENGSNVDLSDLELKLQYDSTDVAITNYRAVLVGPPDQPLEMTNAFVDLWKAAQELPEGRERLVAQKVVASQRVFRIPVLKLGGLRKRP